MPSMRWPPSSPGGVLRACVGVSRKSPPKVRSDCRSYGAGGAPSARLAPRSTTDCHPERSEGSRPGEGRDSSPSARNDIDGENEMKQNYIGGKWVDGASVNRNINPSNL